MQFFIILLLSVVSLCRTVPLEHDEDKQNFRKIIHESLRSLQNVAVDKRTEDLWLSSPTDVNEKSKASDHHEVFLKGLRTINTEKAKQLVEGLELLPTSCPILQGPRQTTPGTNHPKERPSDFIRQLRTFLEMLNREGCQKGSKTH